MDESRIERGQAGPSAEPAGTEHGHGPEPEGSGPDAGRVDPDRELDHALVRRAQAGEEEAFADLYSRHERRAWRVARNMVPSDEDAADICQEAFLRVFRSLERFDFHHDFTTWLYRIVTNLAIDFLRKRRPARSTSGLPDEDEPELELEDPSAEAPSRELEARETQGEVQACMSALAPHFQSVLLLREIEGLACNEIADIVGATHVTVRWRLHRGRKLFQEEWERRRRVAEKGVGPLLSRGGHGTDPDGANSPSGTNAHDPAP